MTPKTRAIPLHAAVLPRNSTTRYSNGTSTIATASAECQIASDRRVLWVYGLVIKPGIIAKPTGLSVCVCVLSYDFLYIMSLSLTLACQLDYCMGFSFFCITTRAFVGQTVENTPFEELVPIPPTKKQTCKC